MKIPKLENTLTFLAFVLLAIAFLPGAQAQQNPMDVQGSPRSALDDQRVLLIGDSQVAGPPGASLGHHIASTGATYFARAGKPGWGVQSWHRHRRSMDHLISRHNPTLLVLILGGNDHHRAQGDGYSLLVTAFWSELQQSVTRHAPENSMSSICWIGPPAVIGDDDLQARRDVVTQEIKSVIGVDHFVNSADLTRENTERSRDGIHFTPSGASDWMRKTIPRLEDCVLRQHPTIED